MKNLILNFFKGFCIGATILIYSLVLGEVFMGGVEDYIIRELIGMFILNIIFGIFIGVGLSFADKNKNIEIEKRKNTLRIVSKIILGLIIICLIALIISIIFRNGFGIVLSILLMIALLIWYSGARLGYKALKKENK